LTRTQHDGDAPKGEQALYQRIRADLETQILSGAWLPGYRIPFEHELTEQYGCARMTVNRAITALVLSGLLERRRRAGTFVAQPKMDSAVLEIPKLAVEIEGRGMRYRYELLGRERRRASEEDARTCSIAVGADIIEIRSRHFADDIALVSEQRIIHIDAVPAAADLSFEAVAPGTWLLDNVPWTEAEHKIYATNPNRATATVLGISRSEACLCLERRTWRNGATVTFVRQIFRGDMYHLIARFGPSA
jgi:GntR family histidine utilization transcriptional repressor